MMSEHATLQVCQAIVFGLGLCMFLALLSTVIYLVLTLVGWRGPYRKQRLKRFAISLLAIPMFLGAQWVVVMVAIEAMAYQQDLRFIEFLNASSLVQVGDMAPDFLATDTTGTEFSLHGNRGKIVLVNFFATWCGPCVLELPHLQKVWEAHRSDEKFKLIVIGREETNETVAAFRSEHGYTFPVAADPERAVYSLFAKEIIPRTYLIGPDGKVCIVTTGFDEDELADLKAEIADQLQLARQ